ncbi:molybdenum cofactor guanylyltransferase [Brachybacterium phenoliresistens]|uniref:molybdenum cofactor guanylyltransferase n=1 Tax=Brachybacterium phenoliresistens TaxID=396014 RepID=UPI0031E042B2
MPGNAPNRPAGPRGPAEPTALIVLAGGGAVRLGGVSKPDVRVHGRRLLDIVLEAGARCAPRVVVAPEAVAVPDGVLRTLEDPPHGGPVAGIAAGLAALRGRASTGEVPDVLVLACDLPGAAELAGPLLAARGAPQLRERPGGAPEGVIAARPDGRREMLAILVSRTALEEELRRGGDRDRSVRSVLAGLDLAEVPVPARATEDVDTWEQHARWEHGAP